MKALKTIGLDILGALLIIAAILFGWLPGIGGIPLFIAGLGLLAINHKWAHDLLERAKKDGLKFLQAFFKDHPVLMAAYDVAAVALVAGAIIIFAQGSNNLIRFLAYTLGILGFGLFLGNRRRIQRLNEKIKKYKP